MNADFFRFWRYIQRFALGAVLIVEMIILLDRHDLFNTLSKFFSEQKNPLALLNNTILIAGFIFLSGSIGILIISIISATFSMVVHLLGLIFPLKPCKAGPGISNLIFHSAENIALQMIKDNTDEFLEYYELRSIADANPQKSAKRYHDRLKKHLAGIKNSDRFFIQVYQNSLTQEQRHIDNLRWDILSNVSLLVVIIMMSGIFLEYNIIGNMLFFTILACAFIVITPELLRKKEDYVYYLNASAGSTFQFGPGAEVADRDAF